jgi:hypothetical protein
MLVAGPADTAANTVANAAAAIYIDPSTMHPGGQPHPVPKDATRGEAVGSYRVSKGLRRSGKRIAMLGHVGGGLGAPRDFEFPEDR